MQRLRRPLLSQDGSVTREWRQITDIFAGPKTGTDTDKAGLIRLHTLGKPLRRGNYFDRWPHNTATIYEIGQDIVINGPGHYVVDSWFHANGEEPEIVPASLWSQGWSPDHR